ncbi:DNA polymerase IV 1 [Clostridia bacterium]|nr:DNA polymerase IV 1 [Clostridia bacterium]
MPKKDRIIFHADNDAYFASVEELHHPELKKVPMAVAGNPESRRGIILAKNQLAKGFGVKTAETIWSARQKCPELVLRPPRRREYGEYCEKINAVYERYSDLVERAGIDESYIELTGSLHLFGDGSHSFDNAVTVAGEIQRRVLEELGLTVSIGISYNKIFAKFASDLKKPMGISLVTKGNFKEIVWPVPVGALFLVGKATRETLERIYIRTIGELANTGVDILSRKLGKLGEQLHIYANGLDESPVLRAGESEDLQSVGNGMTFKRNLVSRGDIHTAVIFLADSVATRMRRHGVKCLSVQVTIKDANLKVITRQKQTSSPTWLAADLARESMELIEANWKIGVPIRMLTITAGKLVDEEESAEQLSFFAVPGTDKGNEKREKLEKALDGIRGKYGSRSVSPGSVVKNDLGINEDYGGGED